MIAPFLLAGLLLASPSPPAKPEPRKPLRKAPPKAAPAFQVRIFTLPALLGERVKITPIPMGRIFGPWDLRPNSHPVQSMLFGDLFFPHAAQANDPFEVDLVDFLTFWTGPKPWNQKGAFVRTLSNFPGPDLTKRIMVSQTPEIMKEVETCLRVLQRAFRPRFTLEAALFLAPSTPEDRAFQALDPNRGEALFREVEEGRYGRLLSLAKGDCLAYDSLFLGKARSFPLVPDLDVELAQKAFIADPQTRVLKLRQGLALSVFPSPLEDHTEVAGLVIFQEPKAPPEGMGLQTRKPRMFLERARIENLQVKFTVSFQDRLALLLAPGGWKRPHLRVLLLAKRLDPYPDFPEGKVLFKTHGRIASLRLDAENFQTWESTFPDPDETCDILQDLEPKSLETFNGPWGTLLKGPKPLVTQAGNLVKSLYQDFQRKFRLEVIREKTPAEPYGDEERTWTPLGLPTVIPCLGGDLAFALLGEEENYVSDYDVAIAAKAEVANPVVNGTFDGSQVLVRVDPAGEVCSVKLSLLEQSLLGFRRIPSAEISRIGTIQAPDLRWTCWNRRFLMRPGETRSLGFGPPRRIGGRLYKTRVRIRLLED